MRGKSASWLVEADDHHHYVTKPCSNPKADNVLAKEILGATLLQALRLPAPQCAVLRGGIALEMQNQTLGFPTSCHFGSMFPGEPNTAVVYDYLPKSMFSRIVNRSDFGRMLLADIWMGNTQPRQAIFVRQGREFRALFVDNSGLFSEMEGIQKSSPIPTYLDRDIYGDSIDHAVAEIPHLIPSSSVLSGIRRLLPRLVPEAWVTRGTIADLAEVLDQLNERRVGLNNLLKCKRVGPLQA